MRLSSAAFLKDRSLRQSNADSFLEEVEEAFLLPFLSSQALAMVTAFRAQVINFPTAAANPAHAVIAHDFAAMEAAVSAASSRVPRTN